MHVLLMELNSIPSYVYTVQSNYNFTHALYLTRDARVFQRGQRNNYVCTYKFTRLQIKHAWFLHELFSRVCHIFLSLIGVRVKTSNTVL